MQADKHSPESNNESEIPSSGSGWTFLTNHLHVVFCLHQDQGITLRNLALKVGITERSVQRILNELVGSEVITRKRDGRRNTYSINYEYRLRHQLEQKHNIGELLHLLNE